jgi:hypothetical protein
MVESGVLFVKKADDLSGECHESSGVLLYGSLFAKFLPLFLVLHLTLV